MPCICQNPKCENPCVCGERYCDQCFLEIKDEEDWEDDTERDIYLGGRFSGISLLKENKVAKATTDE